jgi:hypothetical protein
MSWNYRVCTHVFSYKKTFVNNPKLAEMKDQRLFSICEVYYDENGVPDGYIQPDKNPLGNWEDLEDLSRTWEMIGPAFEKPIIDLDNFPNEWSES